MLWRGLGVGATVGVAALVSACAHGTDIDGFGGSGGGAGVGLGPSGGNATTQQGAATQAATAVVSTSASTKAASGATTSAMSSSSTGMNNCNAVAANSCQAADDIGNVAGDDGGSVQDSGSGSRWVQSRVTEEDSSIFETDLSYTVTLTSPSGADYDLFVRVGPDDGGTDCNAGPMEGAGATTKSVSGGWDDSQGFGGEDNSRWLSIEVRWVSGDCTLPWTLKVDGGT